MRWGGVGWGGLAFCGEGGCANRSRCREAEEPRSARDPDGAGKRKQAPRPLDRYALRYLCVTDLAGQSWCEQQAVFGMEEPRPPAPETAALLDAGKSIHLARGEGPPHRRLERPCTGWTWGAPSGQRPAEPLISVQGIAWSQVQRVCSQVGPAHCMQHMSAVHVAHEACVPCSPGPTPVLLAVPGPACASVHSAQQAGRTRCHGRSIGRLPQTGIGMLKPSKLPTSALKSCLAGPTITIFICFLLVCR